MTVRCGYADGRWGQVHYRIAGAGRNSLGTGAVTPLLMLHPTPKSGWIYEGLMARLAPGRPIVAPDTPGYGASSPPPAPPSIEDYAGEMLALVDSLVAQGNLPPGPIDVMGYHTGSVTAAAMALLHPDRVRRLVLVSLAAYDAAERQTRREALANWPGPAADGSHLMAMWNLLGRLCDPRVTLDWKHQSLTENLRCGDRAPWGYDAVYRYDLRDALARIGHPMLILNPEDDLWDLTRRSAPLAPAAHYVELPGWGHGLFDLETAPIAALVEDFIG